MPREARPSPSTAKERQVVAVDCELVSWRVVGGVSGLELGALADPDRVLVMAARMLIDQGRRARGPLSRTASSALGVVPAPWAA